MDSLPAPLAYVLGYEWLIEHKEECLEIVA